MFGRSCRGRLESSVDGVRINRTLAMLRSSGSQVGSQPRQLPGNVWPRPARVAAGKQLIGPRQATPGDRWSVHGIEKVGGPARLLITPPQGSMFTHTASAEAGWPATHCNPCSRPCAFAGTRNAEYFLRNPFRPCSRRWYGLPCSVRLAARSLWLSLLGRE